jgi:hypothetical protein
MSDKKILKVNVSDFSLSNNTTRKKRTKNENNGIKVKQPSDRKKTDTLKKKSILKMIRSHQEDRYKKLLENNNTKQPVNNNTIPSNSDNFNKEFDEAKQFLQTLTEKTDSNNKIKNYTLKQYPSNNHSNSLLLNPSINPMTEITNLNISSNNLLSSSLPNINTNSIKNQKPLYGCLKNGSLPTFRNYMNQTRKNLDNNSIPEIPISLPINMNNFSLISDSKIVGGNTNLNKNTITSNIKSNSNEIKNEKVHLSHSEMMEQKVNDSLNRVNIMRQTEEKLKDLNRKYVPTVKKRKKTYKRTYKVGKSKVFPRVSVLVSNKTIRKQVANKKQLLKQTSMPEIKKFLMKRGFIKVGSTAPNDVLRKMYESATLICGEIQNHNPENLLYNFMNAGESL